MEHSLSLSVMLISAISVKRGYSFLKSSNWIRFLGSLEVGHDVNACVTKGRYQWYITTTDDVCLALVSTLSLQTIVGPTTCGGQGWELQEWGLGRGQ